MTLLDLMDAIQVHAAAAAVTAGGATFTDVQVGFAPTAKGRCVRVFYGGEREPERFTSDETLTSKLVAQAINVRGYWPTASTAAKEQRAVEGQMAVFTSSLRTRLLGDSDLGAHAQDGLKMHLAVPDQVVVAGNSYSAIDTEIVVDYDEFTVTR